AELARRARVAEEALRARTPEPVRRTLSLELALLRPRWLPSSPVGPGLPRRRSGRAPRNRCAGRCRSSWRC
ncbi:hypothetical protein CTI14_71560, partial [Methylobacterium radiotolerans]